MKEGQKDKLKGETRGKRPWKAPKLTGLGSGKELAKGVPPFITPDSGGSSN